MTNIFKKLGMFQAFIESGKFNGQLMIKDEGTSSEKRTEITNLVLDPTDFDLNITGKDFNYSCNLGATGLIGAEPGKYLEIEDQIKKEKYKLFMRN